MDFLTKKVSAAVTGLESRLDSVLLGPDANTTGKNGSPGVIEDEKKDAQTRSSGSSTTPARAGTPPVSGNGAGRLSLQERLAAAAARSANPSPRVGNLQRGSESPVGSARSSMDMSRCRSALAESQGTEKEVTEGGGIGWLEAGVKVNSGAKAFAENSEGPGNKGKNGKSQATVDLDDESDPRSLRLLSAAQGIDKADAPNDSESAEPNKEYVFNAPSIPSRVCRDLDRVGLEQSSRITELEADLAHSEARRHVLEEKVKSLAREAAEASKIRGTSIPVGEIEKRLVEKDEKIALLLEEGERLSKLELKNMTIIKKLRAKAAEDEKAAAEIKKRLEKAEKEVTESKERLRKAAEVEKGVNEKLKIYSKLEREAETLRREVTDKDSQILDLRSRLNFERERAQSAEREAQTEALEAEKKATAELRAQLEKLRSEAALIEESLRIEIKDLKGKMETTNERGRMIEAELKSELRLAESKVEVLRARAEEVSSGMAGDTHAKLLRQVETLQTQYAIASGNWQGIESSLLARIASLEKEMNELAAKETDTRRKAREMNLKAKRVECDVKTFEAKIKHLEKEVDSRDQKIDSLNQQIAILETTSEGLLETIRNSREEFEKELLMRLEEERTKCIESLQHMIPVSPPLPSESEPLRRSPTGTTDGLGLYLNSARREISRSPSTEPPLDGRGRGIIRSRPSFSSPTGLESLVSPQRFVHSLSNLPHNSSRSSLAIVAGESVMADEDDDYFNISRDFNTVHPGSSSIPISPQARNFSHDIVSVSTVAAGPSVQLVERMSATVRRLETEKAATKEELARMSAQRDEARQEIVELMREVEKKREFEERYRVLEVELQELNLKHETTLELLGEKTEEVEELKADVADLKQMYRDLVSSTMK